MEALARVALTRPGNVVFPANRPFVKDLHAAGGRVVRQPSGHLVFYGPEGRRFLATDPEGNPLHECEWAYPAPGQATLLRARLHLEWGGWVGLRPHGLINATTLDFSRKPGWERLTPDDLRLMAAQALRMPIEAVRFFYGDDDLAIDAAGRAMIRHKKDVYYVLDDGTFGQARFMACMGAMRWERIDFLPVVELFQSLLPGTGSATFELIRGLYDDQNPSTPAPLRYRGIPPYPSEAAFKLFSAFFTPQAPGGGDPFPLFMDAPRSHEVTWLPAPAPPLRYFDTTHNLCVTVQGGQVQKVVKQDDPAGLPFVAPVAGMPVPFERSVTVANRTLCLRDQDTTTSIPLPAAWGPIQDTPPRLRVPATREGEGERGWRALFGGQPPTVVPRDAFSAVLLYPDDDTEIGEVASQPFVADHLQDSFEQDPRLAASLAGAAQVLIDNFDGAIRACVHLERPRRYRILYTRPAYAQKQAQHIWSELARARRSDIAGTIVFLPKTGTHDAYRSSYDLLFVWIPFAAFDDADQLQSIVRALSGAIAPGGVAFLVGPASLHSVLRVQPHVELAHAESVESLQTFQMHRTILPKARLRAGLTLFRLARR